MVAKRGNGKREYGHPDLSEYVFNLDGSPMVPDRRRKIFRAHSNPNYGVLRDGREVQYLQVGMTARHKWYLKGTGRGSK